MATPHIHRSQVFVDLWRATRPYRKRALLALALLVAAKVTSVGVPIIFKAIVDTLTQPQSWRSPSQPLAGGQVVVLVPIFLLIAYALLRFAGTLFTELRDLVFARVGERTVSDYAQRVFGHLLGLGSRFHVHRQTGALIRDVERGTSGIGFLLGAGLFTVVPTLVEFAGVLLVMGLGYQLSFTLAIIVTFFVYAGYTMALTQQREVRQRLVNEMDSRANARLVDTLLNYETVKTYAREAFEVRRYAAICAQWVDSSVRNQRALSTLHIGQSAIIAAGVAAVMLLAADQTVRGLMTVGDLVLVNAYVIQICLPLNTLGFVFRETKDALVNTERLLALLREPPEIDDRPDSPALQVRGGAVSFEHIDFSYDSGRQVLWDVNLTIAAGQTLAVVGGSGSGKSTLAKLLLRLVEPGAGRITIDGQDIRAVRLGSLREAIGIVPQDSVLFNDSIAYNIGYGRIGSGMADIIEAAKAAQVHEFIVSLPQQYDTWVGERGLRLSGGEKQRMAIARALLKNPPIMIFDEATSALDTRSERAIQGELDRMAVGRTSLIIAHRLSTIVRADAIVVMDKGRIVERGRHEDLLALDGLYAQLWNLQRQQQEFERLQRRMARQAINLADLVASTLDGLRATIEASEVSLYTDIDLENAGVSGDPSTLAQAVHDLCLWGLQATPAQGRMELKLERHATNARLTVRDGRHSVAPGWPSEPRPAPPGAGPTPPDPLELRSSIERQGGQFSIALPNSTQGMAYIIELPLRALDLPSTPTAHRGSAADAPQDGEAARWPSTPQPLAGLRLMCIDDRADALMTLQMLLEHEGAQVIAFGSGALAEGWLQSQPLANWPHLLICDIALGDEDGHVVMRHIRQLEAQRTVPLEHRMPAIALTGLAQPSDRVRALMAGFQVHLAKPVNPLELLSVVLSLSQRDAALRQDG